jgi:multidrug resistance protein MdtO
MTSVSDSASPQGLSALLRRELHLDASRVRSIARIAAGTAIAVTVAMVFQIPLPSYVAYLIFLLSQEDIASTLVTAVGGLVSVTLAVALSLLFYVFDASEPALRIPLLLLSTFLGTFLARTSTLGPIAFLSGFILVLSQTLIDDVPSTEVLTHTVLWLWVVVATPVFTVVVVNLLTGESPVSLSRQRAAVLMEAVAAYIEQPLSQDPSLLRDKLVALNQLKGKAFLWDKKLKAFAFAKAARSFSCAEASRLKPSRRCQTAWNRHSIPPAKPFIWHCGTCIEKPAAMLRSAPQRLTPPLRAGCLCRMPSTIRPTCATR